MRYPRHTRRSPRSDQWCAQDGRHGAHGRRRAPACLRVGLVNRVAHRGRGRSVPVVTFHAPSAASKARATARHRAEREARQADLTARLVEAWRAEPDREYADAFYGELLAARGVDTAAL